MENENIKTFTEALRQDEALRAKYHETIQAVRDEGVEQSDSGVFAEAAARLGYSISPEDLDQAHAAAQKLDDSELEAVSGGGGRKNWCYGGKYACFVAALHDPSSDNEEEACLMDYSCVFVNKSCVSLSTSI